MNTRIYSRESLEQSLEENLYRAYEEGRLSIDFLLLFPVTDNDKNDILTLAKIFPVTLDAKWRFGTVMFTAYIRHS
ncbi:TPA: hypothetical protein U7D35_002018 [Streptococcus agalactiae]|nr:hypothetical protein [Streptococcus agalactiae]HEN7902887.1 hypothetical protein [Streptococcus agalactiae]